MPKFRAHAALRSSKRRVFFISFLPTNGVNDWRSSKPAKTRSHIQILRPVSRSARSSNSAHHTYKVCSLIRTKLLLNTEHHLDAKQSAYEALKHNYPALSNQQLAYINMLECAWRQHNYALANRDGNIKLDWAQSLRLLAALSNVDFSSIKEGSYFKFCGITRKKRPYVFLSAQ